MDAIERIEEKRKALTAARDHLMVEKPLEMLAIEELSEMIVKLSAREVALSSSGAVLLPISPKDVASLQAAVQRLENAISQSAAVPQILYAANALASLPGDDGTEVKGDVLISLPGDDATEAKGDVLESLPGDDDGTKVKG